MPSWLTNDPTLLYIVLATATLGLLAAWRTQRRRESAVGAILAVLLMAVVWLVGYLSPSETTTVMRTIEAMARAGGRGDMNVAFRDVSNDFQHRLYDKHDFRKRVDAVLQRYEIKEIRVWDFEPGEISRPKRVARIGFHLKVRGSWSAGLEYLYCDTEFVLEADGKWRLKGFELFNPLDRRQQITVPGF
jgi:hypothetical protein